MVVTPPVLVPGTGFTGGVDQALVTGAGQYGSDAVAIARWDAVPNQDVGAGGGGDGSTFGVGVLAYHVNGVDRVEFRVNGGPAAVVRQMSVNPTTGVEEYWATLRLADYAPGQKLEVRAVAYPSGAGTSRALDPLTLWVPPAVAPAVYVSPSGSDQTGDGTAARPYRTVLKATMEAAAGATVYLSAGRYGWWQRGVGYRDDGGKWLTVTPAPGVAASDVTVAVDVNMSMRAGRLRFKGLRLDLSSNIPLDNSQMGVWLDGCETFGDLSTASPTILTPLQPQFAGALYLTGGSVHDVPYTPVALPELVRGVAIRDVYDHGINDPRLMVDSTIDNVVPSPAEPGAHVDGIFWYSVNQDVNAIVKNVTMTNIDGLSIFSDRGLRNLALVNVSSTAVRVGVGGINQFGKGIYDNRLDHLVFDNVRLPNQRFCFVDDTPNNVWSNSVIRNSVAMAFMSQNPKNRIRNCRWPDGTRVRDK